MGWKFLVEVGVLELYWVDCLWCGNCEGWGFGWGLVWNCDKIGFGYFLRGGVCRLKRRSIK